jgi:tetratricopeptide (TPR) repeat protein
MKQLIKYSLFTAMLAVGASCTKLDEELPAQYTDTFKPNNSPVGVKNNVNKAQPTDGLQGAFSAVLSGTATNGGFFALQEAGTDEAVITQIGGDWYDGGLYIAIHHHQFTSTTWSINGCWGDAYNGILQSNKLLDAGGLSNEAVAQLRFLRAFFYWRLMDVFGNIPLPTHADDVLPQTPRAQVYTFVVGELNAALADLPAGLQAYGRANKAGAHALLCRIYLNAEIYSGTAQYQKAIDEANAVIDEGIYSLDPDYAAIFSPGNVENQEHIFVAPFDESTGTGENWAQMTLHYPSQLTYKLQQQPWNGFSTLEDFYKSYDTAKDVRGKANFIVGPQYDLLGQPVLDLAYDKGDPDGAPVNYTPFVNMLEPNASRQGGARFGKFSFKQGQKPDMDNDFPLLRYTEVLMNKAEALFRKNGFGDADGLTLVNQVTQRSWPTKTWTTITEGDLLAERGREFFVEAMRRTDLIRFGHYGDSWWENSGDDNFPNHLIMAIPQEQMNASLITTQPLEQNPGY